MRAVIVCIILASLLLGGCGSLQGIFLGQSEEEIKFQNVADISCKLGVNACGAEQPFYYDQRVCVNAAEFKMLYDMDTEEEAAYFAKLSAIRSGEQSLVCGIAYPDQPYMLKNGSCADKAQLDAHLKGFSDMGFDSIPGPIENGGVGDCTSEARSAGKSAPPALPDTPGTQQTDGAEETVPCTKEGYCFPSCSTDGITLTRYTCRRDTCFPEERVNCMKEYGVSCIQTYVTLHGKQLTDPSGNFLLTGYCYGRPEKLS